MAPNEDLPDSPVVAELKRIDDEYLAIEREYEREVEELQRVYTEKQKPFLFRRTRLLRKGDGEADAPVTGTPALRGFWLQALRNHPAFEEEIEEWDEPVLEYICDIKKDNIDPRNSEKGFKFEFHFVENPYFENRVLTKEYHTREGSPYTGDIEVTEIASSPIEWKAGKDVTVEKGVAKKAGKKKQGKPSKAKDEPRSSFFRHFFRSLKEGGPLPDDFDPESMKGMCEDSDDEADEEQIIAFMLENDHEGGCALRDNIIPFAVRWYTGEAAPEEDDDDEGDEEEDDDDEDEEDDDEDESEDEPPARGRKGAPKGKAKALFAAKEGGDGEKKEECKQQ